MVITTKQLPGVSLVVIDREERGNSLDEEHALELSRVVNNQCRQDSIHIVALRGSGSRFFTTGIDLIHLYREVTMGQVYEYIIGSIGSLFNSILFCQKPFVVFVNGYALGLGAEIVALSDIAVGLSTARIGIPALRWGLVPPLTPILSSLSKNSSQVGSYLLFSSRVVDASEAQRLGILHKVFTSEEEAHNWLVELAESISKLDKYSIQVTLHQLRSRKREAIDWGLYWLALSATNPHTVRRLQEFVKKRERNRER